MRRRVKIAYRALINFTYKCFYWAMINLPIFKFYQRIYGNTKNKDITRECDDRWDVMGPILTKNKGTLLDIGCNLGYFSFKAAEGGCFSYGIEGGDFNITCCNAIKSATKSKNCLFMKSMIDPEYTAQMPAYDNIINLSVFHHWAKAYGPEAAQQMMKEMAAKCQTMIFETGQSDEVGSQWPKHLSFMGDNPKEWIHNFLLEIGFKNVEIIGTFPTGLTKVDRYLYLATK